MSAKGRKIEKTHFIHLLHGGHFEFHTSTQWLRLVWIKSLPRIMHTNWVVISNLARNSALIPKFRLFFYFRTHGGFFWTKLKNNLQFFMFPQTVDPSFWHSLVASRYRNRVLISNLAKMLRFWKKIGTFDFSWCLPLLWICLFENR